MSSAHALIIDDNHANIDVLAMLLAEQGLTHTAIDSLRHLSACLDQLGQVDVIFLDLEFPNGDGFSAFNHLQADARLQGVPVVAYTVHTSEINQVKAAGFHSFLGKPLNARRFPDQLKRILNHVPVWE